MPDRRLVGCVFFLALGGLGSSASPETTQVSSDWTVFATGLTNPRHVRAGPGSALYVAEAGIGGDQLATCEPVDNYSTQPGPYMAGYSGRTSKVLSDGTRETVASGLPSARNGYGNALGPSDIAWLGGAMYVVLEGGGCSRGLPNDPAGIARINEDGTYTLVADISAFVRANPVASEPACGPGGDCEPDGVPHSLLAGNKRLLVVETNHNSILRVDPKTGAIERLFDLSAQDPAPTILIRNGTQYLLGFFDGLIQRFDQKFSQVRPFDSGYGPIVDMTTIRKDLYVLETFSGDVPFEPESGRVIRRGTNGVREIVASGLDFPIGMTRGSDGALYVSTVSYGQGPVPGLGQIVRIDVP